MSGFTPGPWVQGGRNTDCVWTSSYGEPKKGMGDNDTWIDCNSESNARLIAAAPTYYAVTDAFFAYEAAVEAGDDVAAMQHFAEASRLLREAHAKATGEAA